MGCVVNARTGLLSSTTTLETLRQAFGRSTAPWAHHRYEVDDHGWIAQSGAQQPDYNLALVHTGDVKRHVTDIVESVHGARIPTLVMLAGRGLSAAQVLADKGWVSIMAMPFVGTPTGDYDADSGVRELTADLLPEAQALASAAFGVGPEVAALAYSEEMLAREDTLFTGLQDDDGVLVACALMCRTEGAGSGWTVATLPGRRRAGYGSRLTTGTLAIDAAHRGSVPCLGLSSPDGLPLYTGLGFELLEYWQVWTRPRWVLGAA